MGLECLRELEGKFGEMTKSDEDEREEGLIRVIRLRGNEEFNFKVEFERKERISITIRHKYVK